MINQGRRGMKTVASARKVVCSAEDVRRKMKQKEWGGHKPL